MPYNLPMARAGWRWRASAVGCAALGLAGLVGLVGIVLLIWRVPPALYAYVPDPKDRAAAEASTRTGLIAGLAGLGALGSLAIATRTYRLTQQGQSPTGTPRPSSSWAVTSSTARLDEADLSGAHLEGADLSGAVLDGVDLRKANGLTQAQLDTARGNASTRLPDGLRRPASWEAEETSTASSL
jgi:hypothetical protein